MAKVTVTVDTDTKQATMEVDGESVNYSDFSIGRYTSGPCCSSEDKVNNDKKYTYISFTQREGNSSYSTQISFDSDNGETYSYSVTNHSLAKEIGKIHRNHSIANKMAKSLGKRKPIATIDCGTNNKYMQPRSEDKSSDKKD